MLWGEVDDFKKGSIFEAPQRTMDASQRRLWRLRSAVLFAALCTEAYANELLDELLAPSDAEALDRLPTFEKLIVTPKVAGLESSLERGREPMQTIRTLFRTRDALVHPRRGKPSAFAIYSDESDEALIGPRAAGQHIIAVATLMEAMDPLRPPPVIFAPGKFVAKHPSVLDAHLQEIGAELNSVPPEHGPSPVSLSVLASRREAEIAQKATAEKNESEGTS